MAPRVGDQRTCGPGGPPRSASNLKPSESWESVSPWVKWAGPTRTPWADGSLHDRESVDMDWVEASQEPFENSFLSPTTLWPSWLAADTDIIPRRLCSIIFPGISVVVRLTMLLKLARFRLISVSDEKFEVPGKAIAPGLQRCL
eukprot:TRINITY_DN94289_c0_g1_i1.p2 TRINITY_DN94289_c0_g1~~TRINITY_DN94289_c0_g1_i1.p2  ORF type:complete len:144 (+),score=7.07 TRINITY_DN94289_c0_g1_i1:310-741(+)